MGRAVKGLREDIEILRELFNASSYPGPEPGSSWSPQVAYPPTWRQDQGLDPDRDEAERRSFRDKYAAKRRKLRTLVLWLQKERR